MSTRFLLPLLLVSLVGGTSHGQSRTRDGATAGGVAGAIIGGIIGHQNDETPEGALIGGAVGAITGGLIGKAQDNELARQRYYQQQAYYQQQQQTYAQQQTIVNSGVSSADVVNMSRSGLSESLIINQLQSKGVQRRLSVSEIIALHQQGVSDHVITAMQSAPLATELVASTPVGTSASYSVPPRHVIVKEPVIYHSPVIVEEFYRPYPVYRHHHHFHRGSSIHIGF